MQRAQNAGILPVSVAIVVLCFTDVWLLSSNIEHKKQTGNRVSRTREPELIFNACMLTAALFYRILPCLELDENSFATKSRLIKKQGTDFH